MKFVEINFIKFLSLNIFSISIPEVLDTYCEMLWYPEALKNAESLKKRDEIMFSFLYSKKRRTKHLKKIFSGIGIQNICFVDLMLNRKWNFPGPLIFTILWAFNLI